PVRGGARAGKCLRYAVSPREKPAVRSSGPRELSRVLPSAEIALLKVRVIPILLVQDGLLKKPVQFRNPRTVANPISIVRVFEERQVDELMLLDIGRTVDEDDVDPLLVRNIAEELYVPFGYGG